MYIKPRVNAEYIYLYIYLYIWQKHIKKTRKIAQFPQLFYVHHFGPET